ncbi:exported protein (hyp9) [Plasmodium reichenowi]|uniref:Exported protein (Hyp9) n=1 Tax=Plasmodium reichenowi TaxID=5854 RepID=A0A151LVC5_PLARE|nr:exported protein (hyp9) [Plasmodium reichenowi]KYO03129.1 exported protein (hyp9) [Plasmodium reichenowi]
MGYSNNKFNIFILWNNIILYFILIVTFTFYNKDFFNKYNGEKSNIGASFNFGNNRSLAEYYKNKDGYNVLRINLDHKNLKGVLGNMHPEIKMVEVDSESICPGTNEVNLKVLTNIPPDMIKVNAKSENMSVGEWDYIMQYYGHSTPKEVSKLDLEIKDKIEKKIKKKKRKTPLIRYIAEIVGYGIILIPGFPVLVGVVVVGFCILIFMGKKSAKNYFSTIKKWLF